MAFARRSGADFLSVPSLSIVPATSDRWGAPTGLRVLVLRRLVSSCSRISAARQGAQHVERGSGGEPQRRHVRGLVRSTTLLVGWPFCVRHATSPNCPTLTHHSRLVHTSW